MVEVQLSSQFLYQPDRAIHIRYYFLFSTIGDFAAFLLAVSDAILTYYAASQSH